MVISITAAAVTPGNIGPGGDVYHDYLSYADNTANGSMSSACFAADCRIQSWSSSQRRLAQITEASSSLFLPHPPDIHIIITQYVVLGG